MGTFRAGLLLFILLALFACRSEAGKRSKAGSLSRGRGISIADSIPKATGYVNDYEKIFTAFEIDDLTALIDSVEKATTIQIAVVTWNLQESPGSTLDSLNLRTARKWGVGVKGKDNGIFIGLCNRCRKINIQNGLGIEAVYSNEETSTLLSETIIPLLKEGKTAESMKAGIRRMIAEVAPRLQ